MRILVISLLSGLVLAAAPQLQLSPFSPLPLDIVVGQNGPTQSVTATNIGDGSLTLTASSSVAWIAPSIVGSTAQMALNTASLAKGSYTGFVTVNALNAIDSPQTVSITVQMGGGVPDSINLYAPPHAASNVMFFASNNFQTVITGSPFFKIVELAANNVSNTASTALYDVDVSALSLTPETSITGDFTVTFSLFPPDVKTVPVTLNITEMPLIRVTPTSIQFNIAQGATPVQKEFLVQDIGATPASVASITVSSGAPWLTALFSGGSVIATGDPTGLAPGKYTATVTVASNAKNGAATVPFEMDVVAVVPPLSYYQSVVNNATFVAGDPVAPGGLVIVRGEQFTMGGAVTAQTPPLGKSLSGATVQVNGVEAPIYYVSPSSGGFNSGGQITFQMPYNTPAGQATVQVSRSDNGSPQAGNIISVQVQNTAPRLLSANGYALATFTDYVSFPVPAGSSLPGHPAKAGDVLIFYGLGFGQTSPPAAEGVAAVGLTNVPNAAMVFAATAPQYPAVSVFLLIAD
jgi:uncharacterized protein (TIGR03437 family)